jgi:autotransporter-associated beta strand protein
VVAACAAIGVAGGVRGQTWIKDAAGTFLWSDAANWSPGLPISGSSTTLAFGGSKAYVANNDIASPFHLNQLLLSDAGQSQIGGNPLQFDAGPGGALPQVIHNGSNTFTINNPLILSADTTFGGTSIGAALVLAGPISGTGAFVEAGTLGVSYGKLGGPTPDSTFSGGTRIVGGTTLDLWGDAGSTPAFGTGPISLEGTLTVHSTTDAPWPVRNDLTIVGTSFIRSEHGSPVVLTGNVTLGGTLIGTPLFGPTGRVLIDNSSAGTRAIYPSRAPLSGGVAIYANIADVNNLVAANALHLRAGVGDTLVAGTSNTYLGGTIIEPNTYSSSTDVEVDAGSSLGGGNVIVQPQARLRIDAVTNIAPGKSILVQSGAAVEFNADTMPFDNAAIAMIDPASTGILLLTGSPAPGLSLAGHEQLILGTLTTATLDSPYTPGAGGYRLVTENGGTLTVAARGPLFSPVLTGPYAFTAGLPGWNGVIQLQSANDYTGGTTLNGGTLYAGSNTLGSGNVNVAAGELISTGSNMLGASASLLVSGGIASLFHANNYTGGAVLSSGVLSIANAAALGSGTITASGGVLTTSVMIPNGVQLTGDASLEGQATPGGGLSGDLTLVGNRTLFSRNDFTIGGNILRPPGDSGTLHLSTTGILRIAGPANSYTGGTTIDAGHVVVYPGSAFGPGSVTLNGGLLESFGASAISGGPGASLTINGGTARLNAANSYGGPTTIAGGVVEIGADGALSTGPVTISGAGTLRASGGPRTLNNAVVLQSPGVIDLNGNDLTLAALGGGGTLTNSAPTASATLTINGPLAIPGGSKLDLTNSRLAVDRLATPPSVLRAYLAAGYGPNGDWTGATGLTSSLAAANPTKYSVAYADAADPSAQDAGIAVPPGKLLARTVLAGDANMDGTVNFFDIAQVLGYKYNTGQPASYTDGDLNYDGVVNFFDLTVILSGNYNTGEQLTSAMAAAAPMSVSATAAIPEPGCIGTLALWLTAVSAFARRRRSSCAQPPGSL